MSDEGFEKRCKLKSKDREILFNGLTIVDLKTKREGMITKYDEKNELLHVTWDDEFVLFNNEKDVEYSAWIEKMFTAIDIWEIDSGPNQKYGIKYEQRKPVK